jgi:probable HAF family extracellular repeat protein
MKLGLLGVALVVVAMTASHVDAATRYVATRVPHVDGYNTSADAISASGAIAGDIRRAIDYYGDEASVASFVFSADNELKPIVLPTDLFPTGAVTSVRAINSRGVVVGTIYAGGESRAFWYADGGADVRLGEPGSVVTGINDDNAIAGYQRGYAFVSSDAGGTYMPRDHSYAFGINAQGGVAGYFKSGRAGDREFYRVFRFRDGVFEDLGTLGDFTYAAGINANGDVVGATYESDNRQRPFIYTNAAMRYLGEMNGAASAINAAGVIVGYQYNASGYRTFVYADGVFSNLEDLVDGLDGARLIEANAINDAGQIAARACGRILGAECYGLRLDPVPAR